VEYVSHSVGDPTPREKLDVMLRSRLAVYLTALPAAFFGSFFMTLWLTEPQPPPPPDNRTDAERLAALPISNGSDLAKAAQSAKLTFSRRLLGNVDVVRRIDERDVTASGWAADREGDSTPLEVLVFVAGPLMATTRTTGERPDVTTAVRLGFGAEKNVAFSVNFQCRRGDQPIVVVIGSERQYLPVQSARCP
jgi:hypothetical protein